MNGLVRLAGALACAAALIQPVHATNWSGFYTRSERAIPAAPSRPAGPDGRVEPVAPSSSAAYNAPEMSLPAGADEGMCVREILAAQERYGIPDNLLLAIGLQEAGTRRNGHFTVWPWAVNAAGVGRIFKTRQAALDWVAERRAAGVRSIDVGCMQINLRWHPEAFRDVPEGFNPAVNVDYAARFLKRLHQKTGDWGIAAGSYHSFNPGPRQKYLATLRQNARAANARIEDFRRLAAGAPPQPLDTRPEPVDEAPRPRSRPARDLGGTIWTAGLSGSNHRRSIYSAHDLQPILPNFAEASE